MPVFKGLGQEREKGEKMGAKRRKSEKYKENANC
jgi:hypothetical protein